MIRAYLIALGVGALLLAAIFALLNQRMAIESRQLLDDRAARLVERLASRTGAELREVVSDLHYLAGRAERELAGAGDGAAVARLAEDFRAFSERKRRYDQVRYLDRRGREVVRINLDEGVAFRVPNADLQDKSGRYYFTDAIALEPGELYLSRFDLNIEQGRVEVPLKPMIRVATPLAGHAGVVVLNYLGDRLLEYLRREGTGFPGVVMMVDDGGHYLIGGPRERDWAFMFDPDAEGPFKSDHRAAWEAMAGGGDGVVEGPAGLYHFATFRLHAEASPQSRRAWRLVVWIPRGELTDRGRIWLKAHSPEALIAYIVYAVGLWFYLGMRRRHRQGEAQIARLHRDIAQERDLFVAGPTVMLKWRDEYGWPVEYISQNVTPLLGYRPAQFTGGELSLAGMVVPEYLAQLAEEMTRARGAERGWFEHAPFPVVGADGERHWLQLTSMAARAEEGEMGHHFGYFNDISERRRTEEALLRVNRQNALILEAIGEGVYGIDGDGLTTFFNAAAERMTGWRAEEMLGEHNHRMLHHSHEDGSSYPEALCPVHSTLKDGRPRRIRGEVFWRADGSPVPVEYMVAPIRAGEREAATTGAVVVFRDISDRLNAERALKEAKGAAEEANRAKSEFLAAMSHDIRTPMNTLLGMGELLGESPLNEEQRRWLEVSNRAGESLLALINDILDLSKIESGQLSLESAPFDPRELVEGSVQILAVAAERKGVGVALEVAPGLPARVIGDAARLRQVLLNLLGNAVKFTDRGRVSLRVTPAAGGVLLFEVSDSGIGIAEERLAAIFDPFVQAEASTTRRFGGTGLGLAICKRLVERMGGGIEVESRAGKGSVFRFHLPLPSGEEAVPSRRAGGGRVVAEVGEERPLAILVADDSEDNRLLVAAFLKGTSHRLRFAGDGREALRLFQRGRYDLVLMDLQMPQMDGFEATRRIRAWEEARQRPRTPVVALTAHAMREQRRESEAAGCDYHLTKPLKKQRLLEVIAAFGRGRNGGERPMEPSEGG